MGKIKSRNFQRCPRCNNLLFYDDEVYCLMCGWRPLAINTDTRTPVDEELYEAPIERDIYPDYEIGRN